MDKILTIENILSEDQRKELIKITEPLFLTGDELNQVASDVNSKRDYTSSNIKQTFPYLHNRLDMKDILVTMIKKIHEKTNMRFVVESVWANLSFPVKRELLWHNHPTPWSGVYYSEVLPFINNGTLFKNHGFVKAKQNSLLIFPGEEFHSQPTWPLFVRRHTLAMDFQFYR